MGQVGHFQLVFTELPSSVTLKEEALEDKIVNTGRQLGKIDWIDT